MPRKLPWNTGHSTDIVCPSKRTKTSTSIFKKQRITHPTANNETDDELPIKKSKSGGRTPSTSPPLEPLSEEFMEEGIENDDKYRMVEDEFYSIAHHFTAHLHAAEYKRQVREVKTRNAEAIKSISRPVMGIMPDQTRRKVESVNRSSAQRKALEGWLGKTVDDMSDDSDTGALPYVGTTLHGLMDSPRKRAASLLKAGSIAITTRAAAGFKKPTAKEKFAIIVPDSPSSKYVPTSGTIDEEQAGTTESEEEDDDLDAPILALKLVADKKISSKHSASMKTPAKIQDPITIPRTLTGSARTPTQKSGLIQKPVARSSITLDRLMVHSSDQPRVSEVERTRRHRPRQELEDQNDKKLEEIPSFL